MAHLGPIAPAVPFARHLVEDAFVGVGSTGHVISPLPAATSTRGLVTKLFLYRGANDERARRAAAVETDPQLLDILERIDPRREFFCFARTDVHALDVPIEALPRHLVDAVRACVRPKAAHDDEEVTSVTRTGELRYIYLDAMAPAPTGTLSADARAHLSRGLDMLHAASVAHGDAHFRNIMIGADGRPRLVDFGCAVRGASAAECAADDVMLAAALGRPQSVERRKRRRSSPHSAARASARASARSSPATPLARARAAAEAAAAFGKVLQF